MAVLVDVRRQFVSHVARAVGFGDRPGEHSFESVHAARVGKAGVAAPPRDAVSSPC